MIAVVAKVAIGKDNGVTAGADRHFPVVYGIAFDIDEIDVAISRKGREQCVAAGRSLRIPSDQADGASPCRHLIDCGRRFRRHSIVSCSPCRLAMDRALRPCGYNKCRAADEVAHRCFYDPHMQDSEWPE